FPVINLNAYALETGVAEKLQTMVDRYLDNSRMKDYYDVWILTSKAELDMTILSEAVDATFRNRRTNREDIIGLFAEEFIHNGDMSMRWNAFLKKMKLSEPDFPSLVEEIHRRISSLIHV
ncbi:MAG: nucleotidyl transferase AbiEii/AbiGii toxin family protein, partial [Muribaculaceae bacterium]|nr:nucleotidyl transferase AbiEii/AbiGii toxin family protein [Muribaculaceae bacterium]